MKIIKQTDRTVSKAILEEISNGAFQHSDKLPPETDLAVQLGISRTQLRDSLAILEENGFITRQRGVGTLINRAVIAEPTRIDLEVEFLDMIEAAGYKATTRLISVDVETENENAANKLNVAQHTPILSVARCILADDKVAIHCVDHISFEKIKDYTYEMDDFIPPIFYFIEKFCKTEIHMDLTEVRPVIADECLSNIFDISIGSPLLYLDEVAYNINNEIILYSQEHYADGFLKHVVLRKKI